MYPVETVVAEKVEAMVRFGMANSRMKDFFDVWHLSRTTAFDGEQLCAALRATFTRRSSVLPRGLPLALTEEFATNSTKQTQWRAFCRKDTRLKTNLTLPDVVSVLAAFLRQPIEAVGGRPALSGELASRRTVVANCVRADTACGRPRQPHSRSQPAFAISSGVTTSATFPCWR